MNPIERLKLSRELVAIRVAIEAGIANMVERLTKSKRLLEIRAILGANDKAAQTVETPVPVVEEPAKVDPRADGIVRPRVSTAHFYEVRKKGVGRKKLNENARQILAKARQNPDLELSDEDKRALAAYSGCGGGLLNADGTKGSQYEYYTPKPIAEGIWDAVKGLGFNGGKVLDPCSGSGIFGATAPLNCAIDAVELSEESALVNKLVNDGPGYRTTNTNFESFASRTPDEAYDAIVTNVPFGSKADRGTNFKDDKRYQNERLETYFILRSLEKIRPGGLAAFIVPPRVIGIPNSSDKEKMEDLRFKASLMAEFVGGYRLPTGTFSTQGTPTVTDVIFFRKFSRDMAEKVKNIYETNPAFLTETNVLYQPFISGKYFMTDPEGRPYVLGDFIAKNPKKYRDDNKVISGAGLGELREILSKRRLPNSRILWDKLETTEAEPPVYEEGDHIMQAGRTLEMRGGIWVELPGSREDSPVESTLINLKDAYTAFDRAVSFEDATACREWLVKHDQSLDIPEWLPGTLDAISKLPANNRQKMWNKAVVGLSVSEILDETFSPNEPINYLENYEKLSKAMKDVRVTQGDGSMVGGSVGAALKRLYVQYSPKKGYSDVWKGSVSAEVKHAEEVEQATDTSESKFANLCYQSGKTRFTVEEARKALGATWSPFEDEKYCLDDDGKTVVSADDYFVGNPAELFAKIDAQIEATQDEKLKAKLLSQKAIGREKMRHVDVSKVVFNLHSPYVTNEEKVVFLRQFVHSCAAINTDGDKEWADIDIKANKPTNDQKLMNRLGDYMKNGTITLGGVKLKMYDNGYKWDPEIPEEESLQRLRKLVNEKNEQFNAWCRSNREIMARLDRTLNSPENTTFKSVEDGASMNIPGMNKDLKLHDYQCAFVRKMGRSFSGINGFDVGLGKTFTALAAVQHVQAIGAKKKTVFVVPNSVLSNWRKEAGKAYSTIEDCLFIGLRVDKSGKASVKISAYDEDLEKIKANKHSKIFMTLEAFARLRMREETMERYVEALSAEEEQLAYGDKKATNIRADASRQKILQAAMGQSKSGKASKNVQVASAPYLEDLGIDSIVMDEAHFYKNSAKHYDFRPAKYLAMSEPSTRGLDAQIKAWYIRKQSPKNDGVLLLTATPITNSPLEIYSMLTLAVGRRQVNRSIGAKSADSFMKVVCETRGEDVKLIDGRTSNQDVFVGLRNVEFLRSTLNSVATIKTADDVGKTIVVPDSPTTSNNVELTEKAKARIELYKRAYRGAKMVLKDGNDITITSEEDKKDIEAFEQVQAETREPTDLIAHPFNLMNKMSNVIADPEIDEGVSVYTYSAEDGEKAKKAVEMFNKAERIRETKIPPEDATALAGKPVKRKNTEKGLSDDDVGLNEEYFVYKVYVRARLDEEGIVIDSIEPEDQDAFEAIAKKLKLDLGATIPPKIAALLDNVRKEMATPRGINEDGSKSPVVKQIIFCDMLAIHNKIKLLLSKRCGVPSGKIAIVTGKKIKEPEQLLEVQDGFNAEGADNKIQVVIANKKAEVGINLQKGTQAIHHLTIGWTPDGLQQRNGRGVRQGNKTERVHVYFYDANGSFDEAKRMMVNRKAEWISNLVQSDGGDSVKISGGLTNKEMELLIESMGDKKAFEKKRAEIESRERAANIANNRESQRINVKTFETQVETIRMYSNPVNIARQHFVNAVALRKALKEEEKKAYDNTKSEKVRGNALERARTIRENLNEITKYCDESFIFTYEGFERKLKGILDAFDGSYHDKNDPDYWVRKHAEIQPKKGNTPVAVECAKILEQAEGMKREAAARFRSQAKEEGAIPAILMDVIEKGEPYRMKDGQPIVPGCIASGRGSGSDFLCVVINDKGNLLERRLIRTDDGEFVSHKCALDVKDLNEVAYPNTPEYEAYLKRIAAWEDLAQSTSIEAGTCISEVVPEVRNYRKSERLRSCHCLYDLLPQPYFRYVVRESEKDNDEVYKAIFEEQKSVIKRFEGGIHYVVSADVEIETADKTCYELDSIRRKAFIDYAKAHGIKIKVTDNGLIRAGNLDGYFVDYSEEFASLVGEVDNMLELEVAFQKFIDEKIDETYSDWIDAESMREAMGRKTTKDVFYGVWYAANNRARRREREEREAAAKKAVEERAARIGATLTPETHVYVSGDTYFIRKKIKETAAQFPDSDGFMFGFEIERKAWEITQAAWEDFQKNYPDLVDKNHLVADPAID